MTADQKNKILAKKLRSYGLKDEKQIAELIEQINGFANLIIDFYLEDKQKCKKV